MELTTKTINNVKFEFKLVKGVLVETVESYLKRAGTIEVFSVRRKKISEYNLSKRILVEDHETNNHFESQIAA
jgi:hypothetical protein